MSPLVIIGTGLAGYSLAKEFRRLDQTAPLLLISADDGRAYSKPMLSGALAQGKAPDQLVTADAAKMRQTLNAEILTHTQVTAIDTAARQVRAGDRTYDYQNLVLAVGAQPFRPPLQGDGAAAVLSINNLDDYTRFREQLAQAQRVAIIGPGLIGCEFANDLAAAGKTVSVIGPDPWPVSTLLPEAAGLALRDGLARIGIEWHLGVTTQAVHKAGSAYTLDLSDGTQVQADLVLSAVGLRPDVRLAQAAGLPVNRGIVTDALLQTGAQQVYALGDCAEVGGRNLPFVAPLMAGAKALAKTLAGTPTAVAYPVMPVVIKTPAHPVAAVPPAPGSGGEWSVETAADGVRALYHTAAGQLAGFALTGAATVDKQKRVRELEMG